VVLAAAYGVAMWLTIASLVKVAWIAPPTVICIAVNAVMAARYWPTALNYILNGYKDDD